MHASVTIVTCLSRYKYFACTATQHLCFASCHQCDRLVRDACLLHNFSIFQKLSGIDTMSQKRIWGRQGAHGELGVRNRE